jgi:hypothetical protein
MPNIDEDIPKDVEEQSSEEFIKLNEPYCGDLELAKKELSKNSKFQPQTDEDHELIKKWLELNPELDLEMAKTIYCICKYQPEYAEELMKDDYEFPLSKDHKYDIVKKNSNVTGCVIMDKDEEYTDEMREKVLKAVDQSVIDERDRLEKIEKEKYNICL